jgi:2-dehydro-3-deoxygluconokinase
MRTGGVDTTHVIVDGDHPTGMYVKETHEDGSTMHYYRAGSAASFLDLADVHDLPIGHVRWVHVSGITPAISDRASRAVDALFDACASTGARVSFDVNFRPRLWERDIAAARLFDLAQRADVVLVGRDEAQDLWGTSTAEQIFDLITDPSIVVVKDGEFGATEHDRSSDPRTTFEATPLADVVEVIGAGDAFAGGYLAGLIRGESSRHRLSRGHAAAAWTIGSADDARAGHVPEPFRI